MPSPVSSELHSTAEVAAPGPPRRITIAGKSARAWIVGLDSSAPSIGSASAMLPASELARCMSVIDPRRRRRLLAARATLRQILAAELELEPAQVEILRDHTGRPVLARSSGLCFSLSHAGGWAAIAVSDARSVGVDIELPTRRVSEGLMRRVLAPSEQAAVLECLPQRRGEAFLAYWTAKEAAAKVLGGLSGNLGRLELCNGLTAPRLADRRLQALEVQPLIRQGLIGAIAATNDTGICQVC
jgi:4'-phosphopantetheinyl transferase